MLIRDVILNREPYSTRASATVQEAAEFMSERNIGAVCVLDDGGRLLGVFSERDVLNRVVVPRRDPHTVRVGDVTSELPPPHRVEPPSGTAPPSTAPSPVPGDDSEIDLVSSHTPWTPLPKMVPWDHLGDGSIFDPMPAQGLSPGVAWRNTETVRQLYGQSVQYSLDALVSWITRVHDDNLVLVVLGDHQPATTVSGSGANHQVPISIVAHDPAVLARTASWQWQDGLLPSPSAPVWPMDSFRNRFLDAFDGVRSAAGLRSHR